MTHEERGRWLLLRVGTQLCALPLECVDEIMRPQPVRAVAGVPEFVRGVAMIRGAPVPVLDVASAMGGDQPPPVATRFVSLRTADRRVALAVTEVVGVRQIDGDRVGDLPPLLAAGREHVVSAIGTLDRELLMVLRAGKLVPEAAWAAIEAGGHR